MKVPGRHRLDLLRIVIPQFGLRDRPRQGMTPNDDVALIATVATGLRRHPAGKARVHHGQAAPLLAAHPDRARSDLSGDLRCTHAAQAMAAELSDYLWQRRPLLLSGTFNSDQRLVETMRRIEASRCDFADRDMVLGRIVAEGTSTIDGDVVGIDQAQQLLSEFGIGTNSFGVVLIGKDGGEKPGRQRRPGSSGDLRGDRRHADAGPRGERRSGRVLIRGSQPRSSAMTPDNASDARTHAESLNTCLSIRCDVRSELSAWSRGPAATGLRGGGRGAPQLATRHILR